MILREYANLGVDTEKDRTEVLRDIVNIRKDDIIQAKNLPQTYILGRKVGRIPASSADVIAGDKVGDFNVTLTHAYYLIDNAGTGTWVRSTVGTF